MSARWLVILMAAGAPSPLWCAPARLYNDPSPGRPRPGLVTRICEATAEVAQRGGHEPPHHDARLDEAAADISRRLIAGGAPNLDLIQSTLWLHGIVEPSARFLMADTTSGNDAAIASLVADQLQPLVADGRVRRIGAGLFPVAGAMRVLVLLQESFVELRPTPRALADAETVLLQGQLLSPYRQPELEVTAPDGRVSQLPARIDGTQFSATFSCGLAPGRWQIEINGHGETGPTVLANFPFYCGVPAPTEPPTFSGKLDDERLSDAPSAEAAMLRLLNQDRAVYGLRPLTLDAKLSEVARAHALDCQTNDFVGHISPRTGGPWDRVRRAGLAFAVVRENVARTFSPGEAERGLMNSPGHRDNLLNHDTTLVGIGAVVSPPKAGGRRELYVAELFMEPATAVEKVAASVFDLERRIVSFRSEHHLTELIHDSRLDAVADEVAAQLAAGKLAPAEVERKVKAALRASRRYKDMSLQVVSASDLDSGMAALATFLGQPAFDRRGVGLKPFKRVDDEGLYIVALLATGSH
jgi:uncharacterized protein YkwD